MRKIDLAEDTWKLTRAILPEEWEKLVVILHSLNAEFYEGLLRARDRTFGLWPYLFHPSRYIEYYNAGGQVKNSYITVSGNMDPDMKGKPIEYISFEELMYNIQIMINEGRRFV